MENRLCEYCKLNIIKPKSKRFCSISCSNKWEAKFGNHSKGYKKGHIFCGTEKTWFKKGKENWYMQGLSKQPEYKCKEIRVNGRKVPYSHVIWTAQKENLSYVPKGFVIHHIDHDPFNNDSNNLFLMQKGDHSRLHIEFFRKLKDNILLIQ